MPRQPLIDRYTLEAAIFGLEHQRSEIDAKLKAIRRMLREMPVTTDSTASTAIVAPPRKRRKMSAAARANIRAALKKRWAAYRRQQKGK
jgi:hypothetical protein